MNQLNPTHIELDTDALKHNLKYLNEIIGPHVKFSSVVKGNAYGHGIEQFIPMLKDEGVDHFSVFSANEADRVLKFTTDEDTIMIMGMVDFHQLEWAIINGIEFYIFDMLRLEKAIEICKKHDKKAYIHVELETGMNRTGFESKTIKQLIPLLEQHAEYLVVKGVCTHFAGAESIANFYRIKKQKERFKKLSNKFKKSQVNIQRYHTACSAATLRFPETRMDLVRIGILQYGFFPSRETMIDLLTKKKKTYYPLKRILSWKSIVMDVKKIKSGQFIGYGTSFLSNQEMKIALVPVGYSQGFSRSLSNQGRVLINGQRVGVIGTVNMNMMSVDATNLPNVKKGDEVVIIGNQGEHEVSVSSFSETSNLVNYELLTRLPADIPRIVINK